MYPGEPARTAWDLNFKLFGIHVRVHPMFWLISILLSYDLIKNKIVHEADFATVAFVTSEFGRHDLTPLGEPEEMRFSAEGHLVDLALPAFRHGRRAWDF